MLISLRTIVVLLTVAVIGLLAFDIYQIVTNTVDLNRHLPFLLPIAFAVIMVICIVIDRHSSSRRDDESPDTLN